MTNILERPKINFIFDKNADKPEFRASNLIYTLGMFNGTWKPHYECFIDYDTWVPPVDIIIHEVDGLDSFVSDFNSNEIWVYVLHWLKPYLSRHEMKPVIDHIHTMYDQNTNVHILADYGHESHIPGSMGYVFHKQFPFYDESKYVLCNISLLNENVASRTNIEKPDSELRPKFKKIVPCFHYVTKIMSEISKVRDIEKAGFLKDFPLATWPGKELKENDKNEHNNIMFKYLIPNRVGRKSRRMFIVELDKRGLLTDTEWSMIYPDGNPDFPWDYDDEYKKRFGSHRKTMSRPYHIWGGERGANDPDQRLPYKLACNTICYVAIETYPTYFDQEESTRLLNFADDPNKPFVVLDASEKSIKPFAYGIVPFILGRPGLVDRWRELGMWLPGDYGNEEDLTDRMNAMIDAMEKFCYEELPISEDVCKKIKSNQNLILSLEFHYKLSKDLFEAFL